MIMESTLTDYARRSPGDLDLSVVRAAGRELAHAISGLAPHGKRSAKPKKGQAQRILARAASAPDTRVTVPALGNA